MQHKETPATGINENLNGKLPLIANHNELGLPKSPTLVTVNIGALAITTIVFLSIRRIASISDFNLAVIIFFVLAGSVALLEFIVLKPYKNFSTGIDFASKQDINWTRVAVKLLGLYSTLLIFGVFYGLFYVYRDPSYDDYWKFLKLIVPLLLITSIPYFIIIDRYMRQPQDGYWHIGMLTLMKWSKIDREELKQHFLGWVVKAFFMPLMFTSLVGKTGFLRLYIFSESLHDFYSFYYMTTEILYALDLLVVTVGYAMCIRLLDSHIRSTEPTLLGWTVALICYQPFWGFTAVNYLEYSRGPQWDYLLRSHPVIYISWGVTIMFLVGVYAYATLPFGLRFSNLTHRGILSNGPYRFCKHPAYVSKNLSWWMISMPFIVTAENSDVYDAIRRCVLLLMLNFIYFMRARTEEKHLSKDPAYIEYATKMNRRSIFAWLGRLFPVLQFKPHKLLNV